MITRYDVREVLTLMQAMQQGRPHTPAAALLSNSFSGNVAKVEVEVSQHFLNEEKSSPWREGWPPV